MSKFLKYVLLSGILAVSAVYGVPLSLDVTDNGIIDAGGIKFAVGIYDMHWRFHSLNSTAFRQWSVVRDGNTVQCGANVMIVGLPDGTFRQQTRPVKPGELNYLAEFDFAAPAAVKELVLAAIRLPVNRFGGRELVADGKKIEFPRIFSPSGKAVFFRKKVRELEIPLEQGVIAIRGDFTLMLQDDRHYKNDSYSLRIYFTPSGGKISGAQLKLTIAVRKYSSSPLDLSGAVNAGFTDERDGDRTGGWTDQGATNDLRMLPTGLQHWNGIDFKISDPAANNGKSCIMLAGKNRMYFTRSAEAKQSRPVTGKYLYLLHAIAWSGGKTVGNVTVTYTDGTSSQFPVTSADVGDWWNPVSLPNGDVVWSAANHSATVGLYRSVYPIEPKPIGKINFESALISPWGVVAASVSQDPAIRVTGTPFYVIANQNWQPVADPPNRIEKGSVMDFSPRLDAPAGKYGRPVILGGKIVFENRPNQPVRFFGVNVSRHLLFQDKEEADALADFLAACGYNLVRIHHHDAYMVKRGNRCSTELDPNQMDKLDYLIYALKQRGIYLITDLYVSRHLEVGEIPEYPERKLWQEDFKPLVFVLDSVMANWKRFAENWLTHVNPYTGFAFKDEPSLLSLSMINEDTLSAYWNRTPYTEKLFKEQFEAWKAKKGCGKGAATINDPVFSEFLREVYDRKFQEMKAFVRNLGVKSMIADQSFLTSPALTAMRNQYDFVENHFYWDHPFFLGGWWKYPAAFHNVSALSRYAAAPGTLFDSRIFGKPFMVTEYGFASPNAYRAEGAVLTGAYGALQDWDVLLQFCHYQLPARGGVDFGKLVPLFDSSTDLMKLLSMRIGLALFLDGGVPPAARKFAVVQTGRERLTLGDSESGKVNRLGLMAQVGCVFLPEGKVEKQRLPEGTVAAIIRRPGITAGDRIPVFAANGELLDELARKQLLEPGQYDPAAERYRSASGTISYDRKRETFEVVSPACEAVILPAGLSGGTGILHVENKIGRGVFAAIAVDGRPLRESGRLLLLHLTDILPAGTHFADRNRNRLEAWGKTGPFLAARGEAVISLRLGAPGAAWRLYAVDPSGRRLGILPFEHSPDGMVRFPVSVFRKEGAGFVYELIRH